MSYTSSEQVRHHLITPCPLQNRVVDQPVTLDGTDYVRFYGGAIDSSSLLMKSLQTNEPTRVTLTLNSGDTSFASQPVVRGSVVVASDSSLGTIYAENADYVIDYSDGSLSIKSSGSLSSGMSVTIWYLPFTLYEVDEDFNLRAEKGEVKRLSGGGIAFGETVYLDYSPVFAASDDVIIENAVSLANGMVEVDIDPDGEFEADPTLGAAATYRALEIVCRAAASRDLSNRPTQERTALAWMKLADDYAGKSELLLRAFRPAQNGPKGPERS